MLSFYLGLLESEQDQAVFAQLYETNHEKALWIAKRYFTSEELAQDAVHDACIAVIQNFQKISGKSCQEQAAYFVTTVKSKCIDMLRKEKKYMETEELCEALVLPFDHIRAQQRLRELDSDTRRAVELMQELPAIYRAVVEGRLLADKSNVELSRELGISEDLCAKRFERGRKMLAEKLSKEEIHP